MKKITVENQQQFVGWLLEDLEKGNDRSARQILNTMKKSAYNKQYTLEKAIETNKYSGAELQVAKNELKNAKEDYENVKNAVETVRKYIQDPQHIRINKAINRLNIVEAKRIAKIDIEVKEQRKYITIKADEKMEILVQRLIYENRLYKIDENTINNLQQTFLKIGINLKQSIFDIFNTPKHFESGDEFQPLMEIYQNSIINAQSNTSLRDEEREEVKQAIERLREALT